MAVPKRFFSCREADDCTGIKVPTWRKWIAERRIAHVRFGRAIRIPSEEIDRIIREGTVQAKVG
jgi:excisionase family DNA binding protein